VRQAYPTRPGHRNPPGATPDAGGANFAIYSRHATGVELCLYERTDSPDPFQLIALDPEINRSFYWWHVYVEGLPPGVHFTWRIDGPFDPRRGFRFNRRRELLDPRALAVTDRLWNRAEACHPHADRYPAMRAVVVANGYDWEGDRPIVSPPERAIIYEMHVGGFTRHPSAGVVHPGTFSGVIEKIPYLRSLGITHVELLPVMAFDPQDLAPGAVARGLRNFWGYSPHSYYSPHPGYCVDPDGGGHVREFRDLVKALHRAGIGVILDVVFNHTAEGGIDGPVINFKGSGRTTFYMTDPADRSRFLDYTGCGNTVNCNHPIVTRFLVQCLEYWVREMHVDGFRFDLASVFARGEDGRILPNAPFPWHIEFSDALGDALLIAEAWDAGGLYQVGDFPGYRWQEWNGLYRDAIRRFLRGDGGLLGEVATRLAGSSDLYQDNGRFPFNSVNFLTCHDGFTLWDLVSYARKHNEENGEENRDGSDANWSWNCGAEGETDDPDILALRRRQAKNALAMLLLSQGVPMLLMGDEVLRTQRGNNNAYCQDNEIGWFDWRRAETHGDMVRFTREMIALRQRHPSLMRRRFLSGRPGSAARLPDIAWHGERLNAVPWQDPEARVLAFTLGGLAETEEDLHVILNMADAPLAAPLPDIPGRRWHRAVDTSLPSPDDVSDPARQPSVTASAYPVGPRSVVALESR
jgi:glycogen operon protein